MHGFLHLHLALQCVLVISIVPALLSDLSANQLGGAGSLFAREDLLATATVLVAFARLD